MVAYKQVQILISTRTYKTTEANTLRTVTIGPLKTILWISFSQFEEHKKNLFEWQTCDGT